MTPLITFDVRPEPRKRRFFRVTVWSTVRELRKHAGLSQRAKAHAATVPCEGLPLIAEISLAKRYLSHSLIGHECLHAVLCWAHSLNINVSESFLEGIGGPATDEEERACYAQGRTHELIVAQLKHEGFTIR